MGKSLPPLVKNVNEFYILMYLCSMYVSWSFLEENIDFLIHVVYICLKLEIFFNNMNVNTGFQIH